MVRLLGITQRPLHGRKSRLTDNSREVEHPGPKEQAEKAAIASS
jgi:hypothetical protein